MVVVAYCRAGMPSLPVEEQKRRIAEYAAEHSLEISEWYEDADAEKHELEKIILVKEKYISKYKKLSPIDMVLIADSGVLDADLRYRYFVKLALGKKNIQLVSIHEDVFDDGTGIGALYASEVQFIVESERKRNERPPHNPYWDALRMGFGAPYGYRWEGDECRTVPEEAKNVRYIFQLKAQGMTEEEICRTMQKEGILGKSGKKFALVSVRAILKKEDFYRGTKEFFGRDNVKIKYTPIVSDESDVSENSES